MKKELCASASVWESDDGYPTLETLIADRIAKAPRPLFTSNVPTAGLFTVFLDHLPPERRQHYNCRSCEKFVERFGHLVTVDDDGSTATALLEPEGVPEFFRESVAALRREVLKGRVDGVFLSSDETWGVPLAGGWSHFSGKNPAVYRDKLKTAFQASAEKTEDYGILRRSLAEFPANVAAEAVRVLESDTLDRSEKTLGPAKWFLDLHTRMDVAKGHRKDNLAWKAVATAPPGFCHIRSSMIGTLLEDIQSGLGFDAVKKRWADKMHPLQYQRPTAAPTEGAIREAERLFKELGAERALARRFATLDDVLAKLWTPRPMVPKPANGGVFDYLRTKPNSVAPLELPAANITWEKFHAKFLTTADRLEVLAPSHGSYYGLLTAADPDAPAIIQWDGLDGHARNPVSWYFWMSGSSASQWGLVAGWVPVSAVFYGPHRWQESAKFAHLGDHAFFALEGCRESREGPLGLFPEILKTEFRAVRSVIEAHSNAKKPTGLESGNANGLAFGKGDRGPVTVRVTTGDAKAAYKIDRWE